MLLNPGRPSTIHAANMPMGSNGGSGPVRGLGSVMR